MAIYFLKGDKKSAENKLKELDQFYETNKELYDSKSLFTRNYGYGYVVYGAYNQSIKKYKKAIKYFDISKDILKDFQQN